MNSIDFKYNTLQEIPVDMREALKRAMAHYKINQRELSRRTRTLQELGKGVYVDPHNLNKYLKGHKDVGAETLETMTRCLPPEARAYFLALISMDDKGLPVWD